MEALPSGTVTFLFTDIVGSTRRWEEDSERMAHQLDRHDRLLAAAVEEHRGRILKHTGDGLLAVFGSAGDAVTAAVAGQLALARQGWGDEGLSVRMGLHSGEAIETGGDYFGSSLNRAARVMSAAWGGQILCTPATAELARDRVAEGIDLRNLGEHQLRDLAHPTVLWQVSHPDLAGQFPAPRTLDRVVGNVPTMLSSFVGRSREVEQVGADLADTHLVTLTGPGGVGKTRLAIEVAAEAHHEHPDGVWWCELAPFGDASTMPGAVAGVLGLVQEPGRELSHTLVAHLESKRAVLVFDNCEHLLDAAAELADELCRRCPELRVLATSREPLGVDGEITVAVRPLDEDEALELFVQRGRATQPSFVADDASREICRHLDGIPLAVEMAAARLRSMQPAEIAARLEERFRVLVGGRRAASRQQTLRATVAWSHDLLDDREQRVFRRLAPFAGTFDLAAAESVTTDDALDALDVDDLLGRLVAKSLVVADLSTAGATRYRLLETIRQFAGEQLDAAGEADERRRRHALHYTRFVAEAAQGLRGPDEPDWADRVAVELDNLRAASAWAVNAGEASIALALFAPMPPFALGEPSAFEIFTWINATLALPGADTDPNLWPTVIWLYQRCNSLFEWGQVESRWNWVRRLPDAADQPELHLWHGQLKQVVQADFVAAAAAHLRAADAFAARGDHYHAVRCRSIGLVYEGSPGVDDRLWAAAEANAEQARGVNSPYVTAQGIGFVMAGQPNFVFAEPTRSLRLIDEAIPWAARCRNPFMIHVLRTGRALGLVLLGDKAALPAARDAFKASRNRVQIGYQAGVLSMALSLLGHHAEAAELVGAVSVVATVWHNFRRSPRAAEAWAASRAALGDDEYEAAFARGAVRDNDELIAWIREVLDRLVPDDSSPLPARTGT